MRAVNFALAGMALVISAAFFAHQYANLWPGIEPRTSATVDVGVDIDERTVSAPVSPRERPVPTRPTTDRRTGASANGFRFDTALEYTFRRGQGFVDFESIAIGDVTGDGRDDIVGTATYNVLYVLAQRADGSLAEPVSYVFADDVYSNSGELVLADFNNDGILDVVASGVGTWPWGLGGDPRFINALISDRVRGLQPRHMVVPGWEWVRGWQSLDVDADGNRDVVAFCSNINVAYCSRYAIAHGDGRGGFGQVEWVDMPPGYAVYRTWVTDIDQDASDDVLMSVRPDTATGGPSKIWSLIRRPSGGLEQPRTLHTASTTFAAFLVDDFNADRQPDTATFGGEALARIRVMAPGGATEQSTYNIHLAERYGVSREDAAVAGDIDGDRRSDLISAQIHWPVGSINGTPQIALYLQRDGALQPPMYFNAPAPRGISTKALAIGDLNSDGCKDLAIAATNYRLALLYGRDCAVRGQIMSRPNPADALPAKITTDADAIIRTPSGNLARPAAVR